MNVPSLLRRFLVGATLALAALAPATLGGPVANAQSPPTLSPLRVQAFGTEATVTFTSSEPVAVTITHQPTTGGQPVVQSWNIYTTTHETKLTGLTSNTQYQVSVAAVTRDGRRTNGAATFTTTKKRVRLILDRITITDDGDWIGKGEPTWSWKVEWAGGETGACFPNTTPSGIEHLVGVCQAGSYGEGTIFPHNDRGEKLMLTFAEENFPAMPTSFTLSASAAESDLTDVLPFPTFHRAGAPMPWPVPQDKEFASQAMTVLANGPGFESTMDFRFELFHDNVPYPPNHGRAQVRSNF